MYVITGASGNIGHELSRQLLAAGKPVRLIARNAEKLQPFADQGAEIMTGDLGDADFVNKLLSGATAVFAMIPPNYQSDGNFREFQQKLSKILTEAIRANGIKHVVALSSLGAHLPEGTGVVEGLYDFERDLRGLSSVNVLILRPAYFMENLWQQLGTIKGMGAAGSPFRADLSFPLVATQDIADMAAKKLISLDFEGVSVHELLGPEDLTFVQIAQKLGKAIGKEDLPYVAFPYEAAKAGMMQHGVSEPAAQGLIDLSDAMNTGRTVSGYTRTPENTTPTSIDKFAEQFAHAYYAPQPA